VRCREEAALWHALRRYIESHPGLGDGDALAIHRELVGFVSAEREAGRLRLTPEAPTPLGWKLRHCLDVGVLALVLAGGFVLLPLLALPLLVFALLLRRAEKADPVITPRPSLEREALLAGREDWWITNPFSAVGSIKPGLLRRLVIYGVLTLVGLTSRVLYTRGRLARVSSIHFARWVYLEGGQRVLFASNYDGSLGSYMDEFINRVAFGLNGAFSNGIGYPRTNWLVLDGARDEQRFKDFLRRHELETQVWYQAVPGLTTVDLRRNHALREGLESAKLSRRQAEAWLALL
jgi:hypothetical protein